MAADEEVGNELGAKDLGANNLEPGDGHESESSGHNARENPLLSSAWEDEERAKPLGLVITAALLFVLFAATVLFGGHSTIGPAGRPSISGPDGKALGDFLYTMREDPSCPSTSFDTATGSVGGFPAERCPSHNGGEASHPHD
jgi:hypothetical protein